MRLRATTKAPKAIQALIRFVAWQPYSPEATNQLAIGGKFSAVYACITVPGTPKTEQWSLAIVTNDSINSFSMAGKRKRF